MIDIQPPQKTYDDKKKMKLEEVEEDFDDFVEAPPKNQGLLSFGVDHTNIGGIML